MVLQDVTEREVVVLNDFARLVATKIVDVFADGGQEIPDLHDVVDNHQHQHGHGPILVVHAAVLAFVRIQQPRVDEDFPNTVPVAIVKEVLPPLEFPNEVCVLLCRETRISNVPIFIHAEAEPFLTIDVQTHEPIDSEERTNGALVLVAQISATPDVIRGNPVHFQLREGKSEVLEESPEIVRWLAYPVGNALGDDPIRLRSNNGRQNLNAHYVLLGLKLCPLPPGLE
mmetsp:Transcript_54122/g.150551  ORF Transcript_54122/g.150551 Transcript_54122/m.150551 type:complete len:228 (-) Transcript_54122:2029-2712(-)